MKKYLIYIPFLVSLVLVFFAGRCTAPTANTSLLDKYELERKTLLNDVKEREKKIVERDTAISRIEKKMKADHFRDSVALIKNNEAYLKLIKQNEKINYRNATIPKLDSARARYLTLYTY